MADPRLESLLAEVKQRFRGLHNSVYSQVAEDALSQQDEAPSDGAVRRLREFHRLADYLNERVEEDIANELVQQLCRGDESHKNQKLQPAMYAVLKQHPVEAQEDERFRKCVRTLRLMGVINQLIEDVKELLLASYPRKLACSTESLAPVSFTLVDSLDREGRPIYKSDDASCPPDRAYLAWHSARFGGYWALSTDSAGRSPGAAAKWAPLPFDEDGHWCTPPELDARTPSLPSVQCVAAELERRDAVPGIFEGIVDNTAMTILGLGAGICALFVHILQCLDRFAVLVEDSDARAEPMSSDVSAIHVKRLLTRLMRRAPLADALGPLLLRELPGFPFELSAVKLMITNCRLFNLSRVRNVDFPMTLIRLHDFVSRAWQDSVTKIVQIDYKPTRVPRFVRYLDLRKRTVTEQELPDKPEGHLRFVMVSDTHAWMPTLPDVARDAEAKVGCMKVLLPEGDILLHGGDILNEGCGLSHEGSISSKSKLIEELDNLARISVKRDDQGNELPDRTAKPYCNKFKWVFLIGGNHDAPLHMLASLKKLAPLLGSSVVLLQTPADFCSPIPLDSDMPTFVESIAKSKEVAAKVSRGAVRICADSRICRPEQNPHDGVVLAGTGLSLANNAWSANRAFQIEKSDKEKLAQAAQQLLSARPDIVMTHGPADECLSRELGREDCSVKLHLWGHEHNQGFRCDDRSFWLNGGAFPGRFFLNASTVSQYYLPTLLPVVFDLPAAAQAGANGAAHSRAAATPPRKPPAAVGLAASPLVAPRAQVGQMASAAVPAALAAPAAAAAQSPGSSMAAPALAQVAAPRAAPSQPSQPAQPPQAPADEIAGVDDVAEGDFKQYAAALATKLCHSIDPIKQQILAFMIGQGMEMLTGQQLQSGFAPFDFRRQDIDGIERIIIEITILRSDGSFQIQYRSVCSTLVGAEAIAAEPQSSEPTENSFVEEVHEANFPEYSKELAKRLSRDQYEVISRTVLTFLNEQASTLEPQQSIDSDFPRFSVKRFDPDEIEKIDIVLSINRRGDGTFQVTARVVTWTVEGHGPGVASVGPRPTPSAAPQLPPAPVLAPAPVATQPEESSQRRAYESPSEPEAIPAEKSGEDEVAQADFAQYADKIVTDLSCGYEAIQEHLLAFMAEQQEGLQVGQQATSDFPLFQKTKPEGVLQILIDMQIARTATGFFVSYQAANCTEPHGQTNGGGSSPPNQAAEPNSLSQPPPARPPGPPAAPPQAGMQQPPQFPPSQPPAAAPQAEEATKSPLRGQPSPRIEQELPGTPRAATAASADVGADGGERIREERMLEVSILSAQLELFGGLLKERASLGSYATCCVKYDSSSGSPKPPPTFALETSLVQPIAMSPELSWNYTEQISSFILGDALEFQVWEKVEAQEDHLIATADLAATHFYENPYGMEGSLPLEGDEASGTLQVKVAILEKETAMDPQHQIHHMVQLRVEILDARGIPPGHAWVYCICQVQGTEAMFLSPAVENGAEPVWNHVGEIVNFAIGSSLQFSVWDNSAAPAADVRIGIAVVAAHYFQENPHGFEGDLPLTDDNGEPAGTLAIKIHILPSDAPSSAAALHGVYLQHGRRTDMQLPGQHRSGIIVAEKRHPPITVGFGAPGTPLSFRPMPALAVPPVPHGPMSLPPLPRQALPQQAMPGPGSGHGRHAPYRGSFHPMSGQHLSAPASASYPGSPVPLVQLPGAPAAGQKFHWPGAAMPMQVPGVGPPQPYQRPLAPMPFMR